MNDLQTKSIIYWAGTAFVSVLSFSSPAIAQNPLRPEAPESQVAPAAFQTPATAQQLEREPSLATREGRSLLHEAFTLSKSAATLDDYSRLIQLCGDAQHQNLTPEEERYARELRAWSYNRRGESLTEQAARFAEEGDDKSSARLDREALESFNAAIKIDPRRVRPLYNRGVCFGLLGLNDDAIADFSTVLKIQPNHADAWFNRGELHRDLGKLELAIQDYSQSVKLKPNDSAAHRGLAVVLAEANRKTEALKSFDCAIEIEPQDGDCLVERGQTLAALKKWQPAVYDFNKALELDPDCAAAHRGIAWIYATCPQESLRNPKLGLVHARRAVEIARELNSLDFQYFDVLAAALASNGQFPEAQKVVTVALRDAPENQSAALNSRKTLYAANKVYREKPANLSIKAASAKMQRR